MSTGQGKTLSTAWSLGFCGAGAVAADGSDLCDGERGLRLILDTFPLMVFVDSAQRSAGDVGYGSWG